MRLDEKTILGDIISFPFKTYRKAFGRPKKTDKYEGSFAEKQRAKKIIGLILMGKISSYGVEKDRKIYGNCQVLSPGGILMFRCDEKKANWYLNRNLGEIVSTSPLTVKLNFEPKGLGNHNKGFGLSEMGNKCVSCGTEEYLTRHHVVPYCYRRYFPVELKSHNFHDVLSLCVDCHEGYERKADQLKEELAKLHNAPINGEVETRSDLVKYVKIARTLIGDVSDIPNKRIKSLRQEIKIYFGIKRLTKSRLQKISETKSTILRKTHGEIVVSKIDNLQEFVELWRKHFVKNNECNHLPQNWNINHEICLKS